MDLLAVELVYGGGHLIVKLLVKPRLLGLVPAPESNTDNKEVACRQTARRAL